VHGNPMPRLRVVDRAQAPKVDLSEIFNDQKGLATRRQLLAAGIDDEGIRQQIHSRRWQRVLPGMYANSTGALSVEQRRIAAVLFTSPQAQVTGISALAWHGLTNLPPDPLIHVLVPHAVRRSSRGFVRVQRTRRLDEHAHSAGKYTVCSVARAACDACRGLAGIRDIRAIIAETIQRGLTTFDALQLELEAAGNSRTALLRRALREVQSGSRSAPEAELQELLASAAVPPIRWNPILETLDGERLPSPDGWIDDCAVALEVDSRQFHFNPEDWQRTMRRHNLLASYGALVLHFTPTELRHRKRSVRNTVERTCRERLASGAKAAIRVVG
jgi:hypothetical protein